MAPKAKAKPLTPDKSSKGANSVAPAPAPEGPVVDDLITVLDQHVKARDFKQALKVSEQILALAPGDAEATKCKVVALVQLGNIADALTTIESSPALGPGLYFEKAYCLYRENRLSDALAIVKSSGDQNAAALQLEAQIYHRMGDLGHCISAYEKLLLKHKVDADEVKTNVIAAYVSGGRSSDVPALMETLKVVPKTSFDLAYNAACALIETREYQKAEELLLLAKRVGQEMLIDDEYTEQEVDDELAPIEVQLAYVEQVKGQTADAVGRYIGLLKKKPADAPSLAVASNNLIALRGAKDLFDSLKKFDKIMVKKPGVQQQLQFVEGLDHKLSARQKEAMSFNRFLLLLSSNKLEQARDLVPLLVESFPESVMPTLLAASLHLKEGKPGKAEEILGQYADTHPTGSTAALVVRAQAAAAAGQYLRAAESLERIGELQYKPGTVATLVCLRERGGDVKGADAVLDAAVQWWQSSMSDDDAGALETAMLEAAALKLKNNNLQAAATLFEQLSRSSSVLVRSEALNGLICSTAQADPGKAESYAAQLPPLAGLSAVDVRELEQTVSATPSMAKRGRPGEDGVTRVGDDKGDHRSKAKRKRKRKPLYPKGFDPANPGPAPDPERWLPRRERSTYKPRRKDKRGAQIRGSQGAVAKDKASDQPSSTNGSVGSAGSSKQAATSSGRSAGASTSATAAEASKPPTQRSKKKGRR